jgi:hypothetical protein
MMRRLVALVGHAPGLWLAYREPIPPELRRANVVAVMATVVAMAAALVFVDEGGWLRPVVAWLVGHLAWGMFLAWRLPPR